MAKLISCLKVTLTAVFVTSLLLGCAEDENESGGAISVRLGIGTYSTAQNKLLELLLPRAHAAVSSLKFCFKRLRFKPVDEDSVDPAVDEDNIDLELGEVTITSAGTSLGEFTIPSGTYRRIEFDLENDCASGKSLELTNSNGSYSSTERITIKFEGEFEASDNSQLTLSVQTILNQLNSYSGVGSLRDAAEGISGSF